LDPAYGAVAARRVDAGLPATTGLHSVLFTVTLLVVGLVLTVSARTLTDNATARSSARAELVRQIEAAREVRDGRAATVSTLTREVAARDAQVLASQSSAEAGELRQLSAATGATSVVGPGMVVTLDDAPTANAPGTNADPRGGGRVQDGVVRSRDLQIIVNSLWAAGAEAMMINGQRLTSTSAIRFAGQAILVNYRPEDPPGPLRPGRRRHVCRDAHRDVRHPRGHRHGRPFRPAFLDLGPDSGRGAPRSVGTGDHAGTLTLDVRRFVVIPALGLVIGIVLGLVLQPTVPLWLQPYLPIAVIAALDAVFGAVRAVLDGIFNDKVFVVSFLSNVTVAALIVFLGDKLGVGSQLSTGVVVVLGIRIFSNVAAIRRHLFDA
jgi:small basic protein/uncharacterized protein YlxW (UPF0749 family)